MSAFREALKSGGYGEWIVEALTESGEVRLQKIDDRKADVKRPLNPPAEGALKAAA